MSEKQGRQKQQHRVKRRGEQTRRCEHVNISANSDCYCKHEEGEKKLFDVVCSQRLGGFSLSHADFGHRLAKCAVH